MEVTRRTGQIREMPNGNESFVEQALLHLLVVKLETEAVVVRIGVERLVALLVPGITIVMGAVVAGIVSSLLVAMLSLDDLAR